MPHDTDEIIRTPRDKIQPRSYGCGATTRAYITMIGEIRIRLRLFAYNHFKRHWCDWKTGVKAGKVSREDYDFMVAALTAANEALAKKRNQ